MILSRQKDFPSLSNRVLIPQHNAVWSSLFSANTSNVKDSSQEVPPGVLTQRDHVNYRESLPVKPPIHPYFLDDWSLLEPRSLPPPYQMPEVPKKKVVTPVVDTMNHFRRDGRPWKMVLFSNQKQASNVLRNIKGDYYLLGLLVYDIPVLLTPESCVLQACRNGLVLDINPRLPIVITTLSHWESQIDTTYRYVNPKSFVFLHEDATVTKVKKYLLWNSKWGA